MTTTQRRKAIEVARDVLLQLRLKRIMASSGTYLQIDVSGEAETCALDNGDASFKKSFAQDKSISCRVCAIGAAYIGYINRFNRVTNDQAESAGVNQMIDTLSAIFSEEQLRMMEAVFEGGFVGGDPDWYLDLDYENEEQARVDMLINNFYEKYDDDDQRLRAIMINVIRNNGEFRLPQRVRG